MDSTRHQGKVALVTGAASGIGRATALRVAREGAAVLAVDAAAAGLDELATEADGFGTSVTTRVVDVRSQADIDGAVGAAGELGPITTLLNVAGIADWFLPAGEVDDETWDNVLAINLTGCMRLMRAVIPGMVERGGGAIVNVASVAGLGGGGGGAAYTSSKHGVIGLSKSTAFLYATKGVRCNVVCPGGVATNIANTTGYPKSEWVMERLGISFARAAGIAEPDELAALISFLASDDATNVNGAVVTSDGGWMSA